MYKTSNISSNEQIFSVATTNQKGTPDIGRKVLIDTKYDIETSMSMVNKSTNDTLANNSRATQNSMKETNNHSTKFD